MNSEGYYLGVHIGHDCNVTVMDQAGQVAFASGEERFNRKKMFAGFPTQALEYALNTFGENIIHLATPRMRVRSKIARELNFFIQSFIHGRAAPRFGIWVKNGWKKLFAGRSLETHIGSSRIDPEWPVKNVEHHRAHAAGAFYHSGFDTAWVMTLDGEGDGFSCCFYTADRAGGLTLKRSFFHNEVTVGRDYEKVTAMLGFHPLRHPGKVTGLAAYGKPNQDCIDTLRNYLQASWKADRSRVWDTSDAYQVIEESGIQQLRSDRDRIFGRFTREDIAFAVQWLTEKKVLELIASVIPDVKTANICLSGGVFANVAVNRRVKELGFQNVFVMPAMTDCGLSLGACLHSFPDPQAIPVPNTMFFGRSYSEDQVRQTLETAGVSYDTPRNLPETVAELLAGGSVVARFDGPMEFGPRALGNRSILYHCNDPSVNDWLNKQLRRTEFMPFAPVTLDRFAADRYIGYAGAERTARFMTITFPCTEVMKQEAPAVVHVDGTARPQIIHQQDNPGYYAILDAYYRLTGIPTLINTSFNIHEEPIVMTPADALKAFETSRLDALAIGPYLVHRA
ncbi:MAG: carbamoyltransferase C-terminal domain-containing protein [bacterium]